jgi:hypothetical protein
MMGFSFSDVEHSIARIIRYIVPGIDGLLLRYVEGGCLKTNMPTAFGHTGSDP